MAHVFSDENGNIGTIIVLRGHPNDYLPETHTYHGELEIPEDAIHEALVHNNGVIEHDMDKLKTYKIAQAEARYEMCRTIIKEELHDALVDGDSEAALQLIRDKITALKAQRTATIDEINGLVSVEDINNVDVTMINHVGF